MIPVPKLWPGSTIAILAGGPSLTPDQVAQLAGREDIRTIAIKDTIRLAPWADVLYACDAKWWEYHGPKLAYTGLRYSLEAKSAKWAHVLGWTSDSGLEVDDPSKLRTGKNSGFQAINLAVHLGARRIILLGYDMKPGPKGELHWFGRHPYRTADPPFDAFRRLFHTMVEPLKAAGVEVLNATPCSALDCFPRVTLSDALAEVAA